MRITQLAKLVLNQGRSLADRIDAAEKLAQLIDSAPFVGYGSVTAMNHVERRCGGGIFPGPVDSSVTVEMATHECRIGPDAGSRDFINAAHELVVVKVSK